jgi:nitrite reductase/ring-hydroxylating ferredoxin subunit
MLLTKERGICSSSELVDGGAGIRFELDARAKWNAVAFAIRHCGTARAYVNCCPHAGSELDWNPGEFFDETGLYLICSTHGALFDPYSGYCVAGPCKGASLQRVEICEREGKVFLIQSPE